MPRALPNVLSLSRILLAPAVLIFYSNSSKLLFGISLAAVILGLMTDFADGYLARRLRATSETGYVLDGLGDRAMYVALLLVFAREHHISQIYVWLLAFRDILLYALRSLDSNWYETRSQMKAFSRFQGVAIRLWFLANFLEDGFQLYALYPGKHAIACLLFAKNILLCIAIAAGYFHLYMKIRHKGAGGAHA